MKLGKFLTGLGIGTVVGMLIAPKKGSELREDIKVKGSEMYAYAKDLTKEDLQAMINKSIDDVKRTIDEFDVGEFKDSTTQKLTVLQRKLEQLLEDVQNSDELSTVKDTFKKVSEEINERVAEIKSKVSNNNLTKSDVLEESIDELHENVNVVIDDLV